MQLDLSFAPVADSKKMGYITQTIRKKPSPQDAVNLVSGEENKDEKARS